jgi:hypothetical protein
MNKLTITIEKRRRLLQPMSPRAAQGSASQNAEGIAKMIPIDLRSWIATQETR